MNAHEQALTRAQLYRLLARAFLYPEEETLRAITADAAAVAERLEALNGASPLPSLGRAFASAAAACTADELERTYNTLFVGRSRCHLDESDYDPNPFARAHRMADAAGFYQAFGMQPAAQAGQRPDFIGTELEFMYLLILKQLYAEEQDWEEQAAVCREAQAKFFREHLAWWIPKLCDKLESTSSCPYYRDLASFLRAFIQAEETRFPSPA